MKILSEDETMLAAVMGRSLARYGDGELRLCSSGSAKSQRTRDPGLVRELRDILMKPQHVMLLVCIPNFTQQSPKYERWTKYKMPPYGDLYRKDVYGSAFVTRPDSAPWIDRLDYWERVRELWRGKQVTLVRGDSKSLTPEMMPEAASIREVIGPATEAFAEINRLEREIGTPTGPVILCLGATATVLAARLCRKGVHALDLGHIGMFAKRGCFGVANAA